MNKEIKYIFRSLTESEKSKLHSDLKKQNIKYDYDIDLLKKQEVFMFNESLDRKTRYWLEAQGATGIKDSEDKTITEDVEEVVDVNTSEFDSIVSEIHAWIELEVSKEDIYKVLWAMAMTGEDEKILETIKKMREEDDKSFRDSHPDFEEE